MSCERYTSAIVDHACGAEIETDAAEHLSSCPACRRVFDEQRRVLMDLAQQLELALRIEPSAGFVPDVMSRVKGSEFRWRKAMWWGVPAAATALLLLVTLGSLRSDEPPAATRHDPALSPPVSSAPVADAVSSVSAPSTTPEERSRLSRSRRHADRPQVVVKRPGRPEAEVLVPAARSQALAQYLTLVRRGALDASALASSEGTRVVAPSDLVIAPLSVEALAMTNVESGIGSGVDRRGPGSR